MTSTLEQQIQAIQQARAFIKLEGLEGGTLDSRLNDAGSTLAALNLNKENKIGWDNLREALNEKLKQ